MKKYLGLSVLILALSTIALGDGEQGSGTKNCAPHCGGFAESQIETVINIEEFDENSNESTGNSWLNQIAEIFMF